MKTLLLSLLLLTPDASTRYHDAYVLEVIEGEVAKAAKLYLALARETGTPDEIRVQCEFRFAVTCVLLGRADEARARLAVLAADPTVSATLKLEIAEYRKAVEGIGAGSEIDKTLQDLVFELGRHPLDSLQASDRNPPYRDFLILGDRARPVLRRLLSHPDADLRGHAFRLLCYLDEPDMLAKWDVASMPRALARYLARHPADLPEAERRILESRDPVDAITGYGGVPWSLPFYDRMSALAPEWACSHVAERAASGDADAQAMLWSWIDGEPEARARQAALSLVTDLIARDKDGEPISSARFRRICALFRGAQFPPKGLEALAAGQPTAELLGELELMVKSASPDTPDEANPILNRNAHRVANLIDARELDDDLVNRYFVVQQDWMKRLEGEPTKPQMAGFYGFGPHIRAVMHRLPAGRVREWITGIPGRFRTDVLGHLSKAFDYTSVTDFDLLRATIEQTDKERRDALLDPLVWLNLTENEDPAFHRARADFLAEAYVSDPERGFDIAVKLVDLAGILPTVEAKALMMRLIRASVGTSNEQHIIRLFYGEHAQDFELDKEGYQRMQATVASPQAAAVLKLLRPNQQAVLPQYLLKLLERNRLLTEEVRHELAGLVMRFPEYLANPGSVGVIGRLPDLFPMQRWLPAVRGHYGSRGTPLSMFVPVDSSRALGAHLLAHPEDLHPSLTLALRDRLPKPEYEELLPRLIETCPARKLGSLASVINHPQNAEPHVEMLERLLVRSAGAPDADLAALGQLSKLLTRVRATEPLLAVSRRLLASDDPRAAKDGVALARTLARESLIPDLVRVLDSPDANLRREAKAAIESIVDLRRFKEEARKLVPQPEGEEGTSGGG